MASININYDTKTKALVVEMDGKKLKDIAQIGIYSYKNYDNEDESHIELTSMIRNDEEDMYERKCIYAGHTETIVEPVLDIAKLSENISKGFIQKRIK